MTRRTVATIRASDLTTIRIRCGGPCCGSVTEMSPATVSRQFVDRTPRCPVCGKPFVGWDGDAKGPMANTLTRLADALEDIRRAAAKYGDDQAVEFSVEVP